MDSSQHTPGTRYSVCVLANLSLTFTLAERWVQTAACFVPVPAVIPLGCDKRNEGVIRCQPADEVTGYAYAHSENLRNLDTRELRAYVRYDTYRRLHIYDSLSKRTRITVVHVRGTHAF